MASIEELAAKAAKAPYAVELGGTVVALVAHPSLTVWLEAVRELTTAPAASEFTPFLAALGVEPGAAQAVSDALAGCPVGTARLLFEDMRAAFGLGN